MSGWYGSFFPRDKRRNLVRGGGHPSMPPSPSPNEAWDPPSSRGSSGSFFGRGNSDFFGSFNMGMDFRNTPDAFIARAEFPAGLNDQQVKFEVDGGRGKIWGENSSEREYNNGNRRVHHQTTTKMANWFDFPEDVAVDQANGSMADGVFSVTFPRGRK
ncbi:17.7 kDa class I heat shock protein-like [Papaver somniferum]|uniref:17.7 kDa class I heat shock protein-like n=1 Tax=Papaver somniferum TaxID=3469 RepID=UPI000E703E37|nr:17.7 kDa class I heat shock protein-like [Papaver somniferum]